MATGYGVSVDIVYKHHAISRKGSRGAGWGKAVQRLRGDCTAASGNLVLRAKHSPYDLFSLVST